MRNKARCSTGHPLVSCILLILCCLVPIPTFADGMAFWTDPISSLSPMYVNEQRAVIAHRDGVQRMFIAINIQKPPSAQDAARAGVWIFPVPGTPDRTKVEIAAFMPEFKGKRFEPSFRGLLQLARWVAFNTQTFWLNYYALFYGMARGVGRTEGRVDGVTSRKRIDQWGIHAEIITADSVEDLAAYLRKKNVNVADEQLRAFAPYRSDNYVLVVAWISSYEKFLAKFPLPTKIHQDLAQIPRNRQPSLYVEFPTDKPFYPMRATSGYGKQQVIVSAYVAGFMKPDKTFWTPGGMHRSSVGYYVGERPVFEDRHCEDGKRHQAQFKFWEAIPDGPFPFSHFSIHSKAEDFTQDMTFVPDRHAIDVYAVISSVWKRLLVLISLVMIVSYVSAGLSGMIIFREWGPWARMGLWNCFTVATLVAAVWLRRTAVNIEEEQMPKFGDCEPVIQSAETEVSGTRARAGVTTLLALAFLTWVVYFGLDFSRYCVGLVLAELLIASFVVWQGRYLSAKTSFRILPVLATIVSVLAPLVLFCMVGTAYFAHYSETVSFFSDIFGMENYGPLLMLVFPPNELAYVGAVVVTGWFIRRRLHNMTYRDALVAILPVLGVLAYIYVHLGLSLYVSEGVLADITFRKWVLLATTMSFALCLAALFVSRELNERSTKALRFGVVFSMIFVVLIALVFDNWDGTDFFTLFGRNFWNRV